MVDPLSRCLREAKEKKKIDSSLSPGRNERKRRDNTRLSFSHTTTTGACCLSEEVPNLAEHELFISSGKKYAFGIQNWGDSIDLYGGREDEHTLKSPLIFPFPRKKYCNFSSNVRIQKRVKKLKVRFLSLQEY